MNTQTMPTGATHGRGFMRSASRTAFTLVELLVVITIIGILAALISVAAVNAVYTAKQMRIKVEVDNLDLAMKSFKQKYGSFPPCDLRYPASNTVLKAFVARAFPRYNQGSGGAQLAADMITAGFTDQTLFCPDRALVFWLSGTNPDILHPFTDSVATGSPYTGTRTAFYDFDKTRLLIFGTTNPALSSTPTGQIVYVPSGGQNVPFVYFDSRAYGTLAAAPYTDPATPPSMPNSPNAYQFSATAGTAVPYVLDMNKNGTVDAADTWANPDSIQIIAAGQDGIYGVAGKPAAAKLYPTGTNYDLAGSDNDNVSNFNDKASLEDAKP